MSTTSNTATRNTLRLRHMRIGWWGLFAFAIVGTALEAMHGFKIGWYLDVGEETRRLVLRLGHAHGTLLSLVHIAFAASLGSLHPTRSLTIPSTLLTTSWIAIPCGFLASGVITYEGDPGLPIFAVPVGALGLIIALGSIAASVGEAAIDEKPERTDR